MRSRRWIAISVTIGFLLLVVFSSAGASVDLGTDHSTFAQQERQRQRQRQHEHQSDPPLRQHATKLTGFGSRSPLGSSILVHSHSTSMTFPNSKQLWIQRVEDALIFRSNDDNNNDNNQNSTIFQFSIENGSWNLRNHNATNANANTNSSAWVPVEGIYGIYIVPSGVVWVLISSSTTVLTADPWGEIRKINSMEMIHLPFQRAEEGYIQRHSKDQIRQLQLLRQALKSHELYYARGGRMDITHTIQRALGEPSSVGGRWWDGKAPDSRFFWNEPALQPIMQQRGIDVTPLLQHCVPVASAFVGIQRNLSATDQFAYDEILISRRSRFRAGTRFTKRGADATGAVANYAETEQVCWIHNHTLLSHVQTRGSIPLRWSSPADVKTYRPRVRIGTDPVAQARALQNHILTEWNHYVMMDSLLPAKQPKLVLLNLIDKKKDQGRLGRAFDAVFHAVMDAHSSLSENGVSNESVEHFWFDFHAEVKGGRWHRLKKLLTSISPTLAEHGYFKACRDNNNEWKIERLQTGVVRTNCMDCLDRTNVVQSIIGRYALFNAYAGITTPKDEKVLPSDMFNAFRTNAMSLPWESGERNHRALWADNADAISRLYAGTPALKRDFTRTGKRTKFGAIDDGINSLQRYYLNNFLDADRQEGVDLMTGYASFSTVHDGNEHQENVISKYSPSQGSHLSLLQAARKLLDEQHDDGAEERLDEATFVHIKGRRKNIFTHMGGPTLDLRWLPGDLQSHMKAAANAADLQALDHRTASDTPWWFIDDMSDDEKNKDSHREMALPVNIGHLLGGLIAVIQAPVSTATTVLLILGLTNRERDS